MTCRIDALTELQRAAMAPYAQRWIDECLRPGTTDADWVRAERGIRASYRAAGLAEPRVIVRTTSPLACVVAGPIAATLVDGSAVSGAVDGAVGDAVSGAVLDAVDSAVNDAVDSAVGDAVGGAIGHAVSSAVHGAVHGAVRDAVGGAVSGAVYGAVSSAVDGDVDSAVHGAVHGAVRNAVGGAVLDAVGDAIGHAVDGAVRNAVDGAVGGAVRNAVHSAIGHAVDGAVGGAVDDAVDGAVRNAVRGDVRRHWHRYCGGSLWAEWCAWRLFFVDECGLELPREAADLVEPWRDLSTGAGWWWPHRDFCIIAPRHDVIHRDPQGRLHCADGPALLYPDGWGIWSWHGVQVPREWIERPGDMDPAVALNHPNVEQRRCAAEIIGWDRVLDTLAPTVVDEDVDPMVGTLLRVDLPAAPAQQFLRVLCGTGRTFVLPCVNNNFGTALEANAASWGEHGIDPRYVRERGNRT